jgi:hypothetical protein
MVNSFEEHHTYRHPISSDEGQRVRVEFLFARLWVELGGDTAKVRALFRSAGRDLNKASHRQYLQAALLEQLDAMEDPVPFQLAREITARSSGDHVMTDRLRQEIKRASDARTEGVTNGTWEPPQVTSGSSVDIRPSDKTGQNR